MDKNTRLTNIPELRRRAREHIENGAVTDGYRADRQEVLELLNASLATEIVCMLRYKRHYFMAHGPTSKGIAEEFLEHAVEEEGHADRIAQRITQLGGAPNFNPEGMLARSHSEYVEGVTLVDMVKENLVAERIAVESYGEIIRYLGDRDPTTRRLLEEILATEEEHAEDLSTLMAQMGR
jgi:bacterioferritin